MIRTTEEWEALELAVAARLTSLREELPAIAAAACFSLALLVFSVCWPQIFALSERFIP